VAQYKEKAAVIPFSKVLALDSVVAPVIPIAIAGLGGAITATGSAA
jgi:hypothetical protein